MAMLQIVYSMHPLQGLAQSMVINSPHLDEFAAKASGPLNQQGLSYAPLY